MATVLGKRTRSSTRQQPHDDLPSPKRARKAAPTTANKENEPDRAVTMTPRKKPMSKVIPDAPLATPTKQFSALTLTPATPPATPQSAYAQARALLRSSSTSVVTGRESERRTISELLDAFQKGKPSSSSLYISGAPGTGKTFVVNEVLRGTESVYMNCVGLTQDALWARFTETITGDLTNKPTLDKIFAKQSTKWVLVLDEMDHLLPANCVFDVLNVASKHPRNLFVIGISNTHTLTASPIPSTTTLHFAPYTAPEMLSIISTRLSSVATEIIQPKALELACKKIATQTGDLRASMDLVRRSLECAERDKTANPSGSTVAVGLKHVLEGLKTDPGKTQGVVGLVRGLVLQHRLVLLAFILATRRLALGLGLATTSSGKEGAPVDVTSTALHASYTALLSTSNDNLFSPLSRTEFTDVIGLLETSGLISKTKAQAKKDARLVLPSGVREEEVIRGLTTTHLGGEEGPLEREVRSMFERECGKMEKQLAKRKVASAKKAEIDSAFES